MATSADIGRAGQKSSQGIRHETWPGFWLSLARIFVCEVVLLLALAGAFVFYLDWSSNSSLAEFTAASNAAPAQPVKASAPCDHGA